MDEVAKVAAGGSRVDGHNWDLTEDLGAAADAGAAAARRRAVPECLRGSVSRMYRG